MDNSLSLARYFARLLWLLIHESRKIDEQKVALRAATFVSKEASARLRISEGRLSVNGLVMPQALAGVRELADRIGAAAIDEIEIEQGASPGELLALGRLLAGGEGVSDDAASFAQRVKELEGRTVHVRLVEAPSVPAEAPRAEPAAEEPVPAGGAGRLKHLLDRLAAEPRGPAATTVLAEIAFMVEQAVREGGTADAADIFAAMLEREAALTDADSRRASLIAVRRLTRPMILRPIAGLWSSAPERAAQTERILQRCGQDGVDAVVDQYVAASSAAPRRAYRDLLFRLPTVRESLVQMLADPRWFVVRQAAEFLGDLGAQDAERALAELLRHKDSRVRRAATRALTRIESAFTLDALARALADDVPAVRAEAAAGLAARKGPRAGSALAKAIDDETDNEVQFTILAALGRVATPEAVQKLAAAAAAASGIFKAKKNSGLRIAAVHALGEARTAGALAALQGLANDREREVREAVGRTMLQKQG